MPTASIVSTSSSEKRNVEGQILRSISLSQTSAIPSKNVPPVQVQAPSPLLQVPGTTPTTTVPPPQQQQHLSKSSAGPIAQSEQVDSSSSSHSQAAAEYGTSNISRLGKACEMIDPQTGKILQIFYSVSQAEKETGETRAAIGRACRDGGGIVGRNYFRFVSNCAVTGSISPSLYERIKQQQQHGHVYQRLPSLVAPLSQMKMRGVSVQDTSMRRLNDTKRTNDVSTSSKTAQVQKHNTQRNSASSKKPSSTSLLNKSSSSHGHISNTETITSQRTLTSQKMKPAQQHNSTKALISTVDATTKQDLSTAGETSFSLKNGNKAIKRPAPKPIFQATKSSLQEKKKNKSNSYSSPTKNSTSSNGTKISW